MDAAPQQSDLLTRGSLISTHKRGSTASQRHRKFNTPVAGGRKVASVAVHGEREDDNNYS
jgi:hypothetical protein